MSSRHSMDLTSGPVIRKLLLFTMPLLLTNLLQQFYSAADVIVVGKFAGSAALAAVGSTGSITTLLLNLFNGLAVGANVICANLVGARKREELNRCMYSSLLIATFGGMVMMVIGVTFATPLLRLMNSPENVIDLSALYMRIYFCGVPASLIYNFGAGILRAHGDTKRPMYILSATGVVNVALNLVFVIVFHWSVAGVALATITAQVLSAIAILVILFSPKGEYKLRVRALGFHSNEVGMITRVGIPCGMNGIVFSVSNVLLQSTVNTFGELIVAGAAAASSITAFVVVILSSFYTACVSFSGQNFGARKYRRIDMLLVRSMICCFILVGAASTALVFFGKQFLGLYTDDNSVVLAGMPIMLIMTWSYMIYTIPEICIGCLRGMGKSAGPTMLNILCICGVRILWILLIFPINPTTTMLYLCYPISYAVSGAAQYVYYRRCRSAYKEPEEVSAIEKEGCSKGNTP